MKVINGPTFPLIRDSGIPKKAPTLIERVQAFVLSILLLIKNSFISLFTWKNSLSTRSFGFMGTSAPSTKKPPYIIVSMDGGGTHGAAIAKFLERTAEAVGRPLVNFVDCFAGTSTGGLLAAAYTAPSDEDATQPKYTAKYITQLYPKESPNIFYRTYSYIAWSQGGASAPKYDGTGMRDVATRILGNKRIKDCLKPVIIPTVCLSHQQVHLFESEEFSGINHEALQNFTTMGNNETLMLDAVIATSSAPTYFPSHQIGDCNDIDGGIAANTPSAIAALKALYSPFIEKDRDILILSLGTGVDVMEPIPYEQSKGWGAVHWVPYLLPLLFSYMSKIAESIVKLLEKETRIKEIRIDFKLSGELDNLADISQYIAAGDAGFDKAMGEGFQQKFIDQVPKS